MIIFHSVIVIHVYKHFVPLKLTEMLDQSWAHILHLMSLRMFFSNTHVMSILILNRNNEQSNNTLLHNSDHVFIFLISIT